MNRFFLTASLLPLLLFSKERLSERIKVLEEQMKDVRMESVYGNFGAKTATGSYNLNSYGVSLWLDGLIYKFFVGGTDYAFTRTTPAALVFEGALKNLNFDYRLGFKVGLGYTLNTPDWKIWSEYTWLRTDQSSETTDPNARILQNFFNTGLASRKDTIDWKLSYNLIDLDLGRAYFLRRHFSVFPKLGIRGVSILQREKGNAEEGAIGLLELRAKNNLWGIGILGGTQLRWNLTSNWSFFGDLTASLVYAKVDVSYRIRQPQLDPSRTSHYNGDLYELIPNASWDAGLRWEMPLLSNRTRLTFAASYEFAYWWRANQMLHQKSSQDALLGRWSEDLGLMGVKLNGGFDF